MKNTDIIIIDTEELTQTLIESYSGSLSFQCGLKKYGSIEPEITENDTSERIILINIDSSDLDIFNKIAQCAGNKKNIIIAMSYDASADLQVKAFRSGAEDFLTKPLIKNAFIESVNSVYRKKIYKPDVNKKSKVYTAVSNRKGSGKSEFLLNLAREIQEVSSEKVLLIDLNNFQNGVSALLKVNAVHNAEYYINNLTEDNAQALLSNVYKYKNSSLYIMTANTKGKETGKIKTSRLMSALVILKNYFKYILIDKPCFERQDDIFSADIFDEIFNIVLPASVFSGSVKTDYYNKNAKIILNQYTQEDAAKTDSIQSALGCEIFWKIPKNYSALNKTAAAGSALKDAAPDTEIENAYLELAKYLVNTD